MKSVFVKVNIKFKLKVNQKYNPETILGHFKYLNTVDKIHVSCEVEYRVLKCLVCSFYEINQCGDHSTQCPDFNEKIQVEVGEKDEVQIIEKIVI